MLTLMGSDALSDCPGCGGRDFVRASLFSAAGLSSRRGAGPETSIAAGSARPIFAARAGAGLRHMDMGPGRMGAGLGQAHGPRARRPLGTLEGRTLYTDTLPGAGGRGALSRPEPIDTEAWLQDVRERLEEPGEYLAYEDGDELKTVPLTREWTRIGRSLAADVRFDDPTVSRRHALVVRQADGVRVLDDRSLNGVFVNGLRIEWKTLHDGDEIVVGRYRLRFLRVPAQLTGGSRGSRSAATLHGSG